MDLAQLLARQYELAKEVRQFIENCKKAPKDRRTSQFFTTKIKKLDDFGHELYQNNSNIVASQELPSNDTYFTTYHETNKLIIDYMKMLERGAMEVESNGNASGLTKRTVDEQPNVSEQGENSAAMIKKLMRNVKALIEALNNHLSDIESKKDVEQPQAYYTIKSAILEKHMINLTQENNALWEATEESRIDNYTLQTYYEIESKVETALIELQQHMNTETQPTNMPTARSTDASAPNVQLPRLSLPKFSGDYLQWVAFKDLFSELVHNSCISDVQKMQYLAQSLTDEPKNLRKHLPTIGTNYSAAWNILTSRYDNKRLLVSTLLNKLLMQQQLKNELPAAMKSLHDVTKECLHGLRSQGLPVQHWDSIIAHIILRKLDQVTQTAFEQGLEDCRRLVTLDEVLKFIERRFQSLEIRSKSEISLKRTCGSTISSDGKCSICKKETHSVYECTIFKGASIKQKWQYVKLNRLCANCLKTGHQSNTCRARHCTKCSRRHNTLLHPQENKPQTQQVQTSSKATVFRLKQGSEENTGSTSDAASLVTTHSMRDDNFVLLGTAKIIVVGKHGCNIECKAVLDSGSQVNLVTERLLRKLGVSTRESQIQLEGISAKNTAVRHRTVITIKSSINEFTTEIDAHVIPKIVSDQPAHHIKTKDWKIPKDFYLADPDFDKPGRIDCLLGAEMFFDLLTKGNVKLGENLPTMQNTVFGWVIAGGVGTFNISNAICGICTTSELENMISKFWQLEEVPESQTKFSEDDIRCESHFLQNTTRTPDGKFMVRLPLKDHPSSIGETRELAYYRLKTIEKRLSADKTLKNEYSTFMKQYESLGHMTEIDVKNITKPHYYIPHHCVIRPESTSTKLRVVFDASAHKAGSSSLHDIMFNGPTVQSELFSILMKFRTYKYVLKTDVEKMYRQIWVHPKDRNLQLIMWRENPIERARVYQLNTVTYGTRAAPYLATRCLNQLADENMDQFPEGAKSLKNNFYVDDGLIGANSIKEAISIQRQLTKILNSAGMKLKKWCANHPKLLHDISTDDLEIELNFDGDDDQQTKTLGLTWTPKSDFLGIRSGSQNTDSDTKRSITSDVARIYDPLGLVGPVIVTAKIFIQQLWQLKHNWDSKIPNDLLKEWKEFRNKLPSLELVKIPRQICGTEEYVKLEVHAFADASERAYGAAIYIRTVQKDRTIRVNLLCSKSRVAPLKLQTIPRLELCAASLAAELAARVKTDLGYETKKTYYWSDSQIVLSWINHHPGTLPQFVAHRIIKIHRTSSASQWRHVPSKQNPADVLSRGLKPHELSSSQIWFYGPLFLYQQEQSWPEPFKSRDDIPVTVSMTTKKLNHFEEGCWIYSIPSKNSFRHVQRVVGYMLRFAANTRIHSTSRPRHVSLSPMELEAALKIIIRQIQLSDFTEVRKILSKDGFLPKSHHISSLTPFLDEEGIIRVGGRIRHSNQTFDATHQMILPNNDPLVTLLIEMIHKDNYQCGPQALRAQLQQRFWPLKCKSMVRSVIQKCIRCTRTRPVVFNQVMGDLPKHRVQAARPFLHSGVDYCGPFWVHYKTRGKRPQKAYLAVFCCFATKAVHLELVTELTTDAFIGALKRFIARRGHCKTLYCDNATNFVGAKNQLQEVYDVVHSETAQNSIVNICSTKGIEFRFIPPRSPHFGGLWEAAVKSAKHLLLKNISSASLTYEELETVVVEIEAILNSRPLVPSSSNANDLNAITPGHFSIGEELTSSVDVNAQDPKRTLLRRWQLVSNLKHAFWQRWSREYLNELQQRYKWKGPIREILPETMVIIKEDNLPVLQWPLGRIIKVYKGDDGVVRVCDVKTQKGVFKRPVHRLAPLFPENTEVKNSIAEEMDDDSDQNQPMAASSKASLMVSIPLERIRKPESLVHDSTPTKRARLNSGLIVALIALFLLPMTLCSSITVTKFANKPGIYFDQISSVKIMSASWDLIIYVDLKPYRQQIDILTDGTESLKKLCDNEPEKSACDVLLAHFFRITTELESELSLLTVKRVRRGALDIVGNVASSLFGVLDSNYATQMSKVIDNLEKNDVQLEKLLKNQTSVINSTINVFKENQKHIQAKFDEIDARINELLFSSNSSNGIMITQSILMLSMQMFMLASNIQQVHNSILDILIDSHHNKINPLLFTPKQLSEEIIKIKAYLPANLQLPIHQDNLLKIYSIMKVNGILAKSHVIFHIELPLTDPKEFQLFYLVPIAAALNETLITVKLSTEFLAISPHRDEYRPMSQHEVDACISLDENELLCPNVRSTFHESSTVNKCEIELFNNQDDPTCTFYHHEDTTTWNQLKHLNQWIYATLNTIKLNTVCGNEVDQLSLDNSGLLTLAPNCIIKNEFVTIQSSQNFVTSRQTASTKFNLTRGWTKQYLKHNLSITPFVSSIPELKRIQQRLAQIDTFTSAIQTTNSNTHSLVISYAAIAFVLCTTIVIIYKFRIMRKTKQEPPIPLPRCHYSINTDC